MAQAWVRNWPQLCKHIHKGVLVVIGDFLAIFCELVSCHYFGSYFGLQCGLYEILSGAVPELLQPVGLSCKDCCDCALFFGKLALQWSTEMSSLFHIFMCFVTHEN